MQFPSFGVTHAWFRQAGELITCPEVVQVDVFDPQGLSLATVWQAPDTH